MTQNEMILNHLRDHGSITPQEAMARYGCMRLGARIWDLKREGHAITVRPAIAMETRPHMHGTAWQRRRGHE